MRNFFHAQIGKVSLSSLWSRGWGMRYGVLFSCCFLNHYGSAEWRTNTKARKKIIPFRSCTHRTQNHSVRMLDLRKFSYLLACYPISMSLHQSDSRNWLSVLFCIISFFTVVRMSIRKNSSKFKWIYDCSSSLRFSIPLSFCICDYGRCWWCSIFRDVNTKFPNSERVRKTASLDEKVTFLLLSIENYISWTVSPLAHSRIPIQFGNEVN